MSESDGTIKASFNEDFCSMLEYHLTRAFGNSANKEINRLWCDGILIPFLDSQLTTKNILATEKILTEARIGFDGQEKYQMIIKLGPNSLEACINMLSLQNCLPNDTSMNWIILDRDNKIIELQLN